MDTAGLRVGLGIDVHPFEEGRPLLLGGERIPHPRGLSGHSDADVLVHAVCDALLGALALGDIGLHFPDDDPLNEGRSSLEMLEEVSAKVDSAGYEVLNIDTCVVAEEPKLAPYYSAMQGNIAHSLGVGPERIGIKATTTERLGLTGRGEGIAAQAICLVRYRGGKS